MNSSNCTWECLECAAPNFSSSLFDFNDISTQNSFSNLENSSEIEDVAQKFSHKAYHLHHLPHGKKAPRNNKNVKPIRILNVNCQSITNKRESWLGSDIKDHEVFPSGYSVYRKDRVAGKGGGVFIAVKDYIMSSHAVW